MAATTQIKRRAEMARQPLPNCHGGIGSLDWIRVLDGADTAFSRVNFIHDDILAPGVSIGLHRRISTVSTIQSTMSIQADTMTKAERAAFGKAF